MVLGKEREGKSHHLIPLGPSCEHVLEVALEGERSRHPLGLQHAFCNSKALLLAAWPALQGSTSPSPYCSAMGPLMMEKEESLDKHRLS